MESQEIDLFAFINMPSKTHQALFCMNDPVDIA